MRTVTFQDGVWVGVLGALAVLLPLGWLLLRQRRNPRSEGAMPPDSRQALRRRLERLERRALVGELAATFAHEVKNPLAPVRGYAQMLLARLDAVAPEERPLFERGLGIVVAEVDRINARVLELLARAREGHAPEGSEAAFELGSVLTDVLGLVEVEAGVRALRGPQLPGPLWVKGEAEAMRGVLLNLLQNAAEAMAEAGQGDLQVEVTTEAEWVRVHIRDEGPGLGAQAPEALFAPFFTTKVAGTGLGLCIAAGAVEAAGGQLQLRNRDDGPGAWAELSLLRAEAKP